jgi:hypothetical protein
MIFQPAAPIIGSYLAALPFWRTFENSAQVNIGLGISGLFCVVLASLVTSVSALLAGQRK